MDKYHLNNSNSIPVGFTRDKLRQRFDDNRSGYSSWVNNQTNLINDATRQFNQKHTFTSEVHRRFLAYNVKCASDLLARIIRLPLVSSLPVMPAFLSKRKLFLDILINLQLARSLFEYLYTCVCLDIYFSKAPIQSTTYFFSLDHCLSLSKIPSNILTNSFHYSPASCKYINLLDICDQSFINGLVFKIRTLKSFFELIAFRQPGNTRCSFVLFNYRRLALHLFSNVHTIFLESFLHHKCELVVVSTTNAISTTSYFLDSSLPSIKSLYYQVSNNLNTDFGASFTFMHLYTQYIPLFDKYLLRRGFFSDLINAFPSSTSSNIDYACTSIAPIPRNNYTRNKKRILCITSIPKRQYCFSIGIHPDPLNDIAIVDRFFRDIHSVVSGKSSIYVKPKRSSSYCDVDYPKYIESFFPSVKLIDPNISLQSLVNDYCFDAIIAFPWSSFLYEAKLVDPAVNVIFYDPLGALSQPPENNYSNISCINSYNELIKYYNSL